MLGSVGDAEDAVQETFLRYQRSARAEPVREPRALLTGRFFAACQEGDLEALLELLAADCVLYGDGGGRAPAARAPLHGRERAGKALIGLARMAGRISARAEPAVVNGQPGARYLAPDGRLINVVALDIADGQVQAVRSIVNPEKLDHLGPLADVRALLARLTGR